MHDVRKCPKCGEYKSSVTNSGRDDDKMTRTRKCKLCGYFIRRDRMSDLISRKAVYDMLHGLGGCDAQDEWSKGWDKAIDTAIGELDDIPVAFDVDSVVEKLEKWQLQSDDGLIAVGVVLDIVKGAVKDE